MARNLRGKMPMEDILVVHDIDQGAVERFVDESRNDGRVGERKREKKKEESERLGGGTVEVGRSVRELGERCVCPSLRLLALELGFECRDGTDSSAFRKTSLPSCLSRNMFAACLTRYLGRPIIYHRCHLFHHHRHRHHHHQHRHRRHRHLNASSSTAPPSTHPHPAPSLPSSIPKPTHPAHFSTPRCPAVSSAPAQEPSPSCSAVRPRSFPAQPRSSPSWANASSTLAPKAPASPPNSPTTTCSRCRTSPPPRR